MSAFFAFNPDLDYRPVQGGGFNDLMGDLRLAAAGEDEWRFYLDLDDRHANIGGVCHGGALATVADIGMGAAAFRAAGSTAVATIQLSMQYLAGAYPGNRLHGRSCVLRRVRELIFMEANLICQERHVVAASGVWKALAKGSWRPMNEGPVAA